MLRRARRFSERNRPHGYDVRVAEALRMRTVPAEHERALDVAALPAAPTRDEALARRDAAIARLRGAREHLAAEIGGVSAIESLRDDHWSIMHVLGHLGGDGGGHFAPVYDIVERGVRELPPFETRDGRFAEAIETALGEVDRTIEFAAGLSPEQLVLRARRRGRDHYVLGFVEASADHIEAHVAQLRAIRAHLAAVRERRQAVPTG
jgi:hypothetical protein